jgi:HEAT repeat protein
MAELGVQQGIGFIPFAGIGWQAIKTLTKDDTSRVRASAARTLAEDPDEDATKALRVATGDDQWLVRAAALEALAHRGDPNVVDVAIRMMSDDKEEVKLSAAATVLRLEAIKNSKAAGKPSVSRKPTRKN